MMTGSIDCLGPRGFHRMRYVEWGDPCATDVVICVHGLTRNGRDFDAVAGHLPEFRVICPDVVGRGRSDWLADKAGYGNPQYCADLTALIARVTDARNGGGQRVHWVGTSMGGIIGMLLAAMPGSPIARLVLNDVGPLIPKAALARIAGYAGSDPRFATLRGLELHLRAVCAPFGPLTDAQWQHLAAHSARQEADGSLAMSYDPGIAAWLRSGELADVDLWQTYEAIRCPTLLLRGAQSDLLGRDTAVQMTQRGPRARLTEFAGVGHAPMLMSADQIGVVREFLLEGTAGHASAAAPGGS